jgi:tetratricopeptide (TPR) repeat protein
MEVLMGNCINKVNNKNFVLTLILLYSSILFCFSSSDSADVNKESYYENLFKKNLNDSLKDILNFVKLKNQAEKDLKNGNISKGGKIFIELGNEYHRINNNDQALVYYYKALTCTSPNDVMGISAIKDQIGDVYINVGDYQKAQIFFNENKNLYEKVPIPYSHKLINCYINIGRIYAQTDKPDSGLFYFNKAQWLFHKSNSRDSLLLVRIYNNIGGIYLKKQDFVNAEKYLLQALNITLTTNQYSGYVYILYNLAIIEESRNNFGKAIFYISRSQEYANKADVVSIQPVIYKFLRDLYAKNSNFEQAFKYAKLYEEFQNKYYNARMYSDIANIKTQYEVDKIVRKLELSEKESRIIKMQRYIAFGLAGLFLILAIFIIAQMRLKIKYARLKQKMLDQEKHELENELNFKTKEIENFASHIIQKNIFLEDLKKDISETVSVSNKESSEMLKKIETSVSNNLYIDKDRKEFEMKIDHHYHKLLTKLSQKHPTLMPAEVRLCSLILMELNIKDVAILQNISTDSVKKNRHRLRHKLGLTRDQNLLMYLQSL